jgi:hypothetical protein
MAGWRMEDGLKRGDWKIRRSRPGDSREQRWSRGSGGWAGQRPNRACRRRWWSATSDKAALSAPQPAASASHFHLTGPFACSHDLKRRAGRLLDPSIEAPATANHACGWWSVVGGRARPAVRVREDGAARLGRDVMGLWW